MEVAELGKGWFHKPLDYDMCAAILEAKSKEGGKKRKSFTSRIYPPSEGTCSSSLAETTETFDTN